MSFQDDRPTWEQFPRMEDRIKEYFRIYPDARRRECVEDVGCTYGDLLAVLGRDRSNKPPGKIYQHVHKRCGWCAEPVPADTQKKAVCGVHGYFHNECEEKARRFNQ